MKIRLVLAICGVFFGGANAHAKLSVSKIEKEFTVYGFVTQSDDRTVIQTGDKKIEMKKVDFLKSNNLGPDAERRQAKYRVVLTKDTVISDSPEKDGAR